MKTIIKLLSVILFSALPIALQAQAPTTTVDDKPKTTTWRSNYDEFGYTPDVNFTPVRKGNKWGYVNKDGKVIIPLVYSNTTSFSEGFAAVQTDNKWGYINTANELVIDFQFSSAATFFYGKAFVNKNGRSYFIDKTGKEIE